MITDTRDICLAGSGAEKRVPEVLFLLYVDEKGGKMSHLYVGHPCLLISELSKMLQRLCQRSEEAMSSSSGDLLKLLPYFACMARFCRRAGS